MDHARIPMFIFQTETRARSETRAHPAICGTLLISVLRDVRQEGEGDLCARK
jgi:hypothetical protein